MGPQTTPQTTPKTNTHNKLKKTNTKQKTLTKSKLVFVHTCFLLFQCVFVSMLFFFSVFCSVVFVVFSMKHVPFPPAGGGREWVGNPTREVPRNSKKTQKVHSAR